jgi:addiction module RelE/StbE family toxin
MGCQTAGIGEERRKIEKIKLEWLPKALDDFSEIVDSISDDNPIAAAEQGSEIVSQVSRLADNQSIGRKGRVRGTRELIIVGTPYIAVYRIAGASIQILRILHSSRQWPGTFH